MKRRKRNKFEVYIESFIMTVSFAMGFVNNLPCDIKDLEFPNVHAEDDLVTLDATNEGVDLMVLEDEDIRVLVKEEVDTKIDEYNKQTTVRGTITPISQLSEDESKEILDTQLDEIAEEMIDEELESANYSGMKVSHEYENYLKNLCLEYANMNDIDYNVLYSVLMTIGYRESAGEWNNDGVKSSTYDVGVFQINKCNFKDANEKFGYTENDLRYDKYKNGKYAVNFVGEIIKRRNCQSLEDTHRIYAEYNGGPKGESKKQAVNYANGCKKIESEYFSGLENSISK